MQNRNFTDNDVFDYCKTPGFQIILDDLNYGIIIHYTNLDALE